MNALAHDDSGPDRPRPRGLRRLVFAPLAGLLVAVVWLVEAVRRRRTRRTRRPASSTGVTTFTAGGLSFVLTPEKFDALRDTGLPIYSWATSVEDLSREVFNGREWAILTIMCADQIPPEWPVWKFPAGLLGNRHAAVMALAWVAGVWYGRLALSDGGLR